MQLTFLQPALSWSLLARMIRIWQMSGKELPAGSMDEISEVRDLKASIGSLHGFPICMQQLLHKGNSLGDSTKLDAPIELQLVLLALSTMEQRVEVANELLRTCAQAT